MKTFNLLKGQVQLSNIKLEVTQVDNWDLTKNKLFSVIAGIYIFDRVTSKIERGFDSVWDIVFTSLIYVPLSLFIGYWMYKEFIQKSWTNSIYIDSITKITETIDKDNPLNIILTVKGKFTVIDLTFRKLEEEHLAFLEKLKKLNSRYVFKQETI